MGTDFGDLAQVFIGIESSGQPLAMGIKLA
jgi:hypothetical protein